METILLYLSNPLINMIIAALVGIVTNLIAAKMTEKSKRIWWSAKSHSLRLDYYALTGNLRIAYKVGDFYENVINGLSSTRFVFWSSGKEAILTADIAKEEPLRLQFPKGQRILEIRMIAANNSTIVLEAIENDLLVNFEYLHEGQGFVCDVLYSGVKVNPQLIGTLKGGKIVDKEVAPPSMPPTHILTMIVLLLPPRARILAVRFFSSFAFIFLFWLALRDSLTIKRLFHQIESEC